MCTNCNPFVSTLNLKQLTRVTINLKIMYRKNIGAKKRGK